MKHSIIFTILFLLLQGRVISQTNKYPFDVKITGQGKQAIIFIPGFACSGDEWNETSTLFEKNYKCFTLTMAGLAGVPAQSNFTFKERENAIAAYIKDNHISQPIIIGHSMGGGWALALAADYPDLCSKIIVVDALPCLTAMQNPDFISKPNIDTSVVQRIMNESDEQMYQIAKRSAAMLCADTSKIPAIVDWSMTSDKKTYAYLFADFSNTDLRGKIANIKCPALILLESYFKNFKPQIEEQYKNLKNADLQYADKGLHFIMYDDFGWYKNQLLNFIKQ